MSLYHKYRPDRLEDIVGNSHVVTVLDKLLTHEDPPHAYLLQGPTGCGKTTIGRIIADRLGAFGADFHEIDSADFRGIDTVRELRKRSQFKPLESPVVVWLIDECHKMTSDAQNALLKILEDPPSHIYFILSTTEPNKLIKTITGRCQVLDLKPLNERETRILLKRIVEAEGENLLKPVYEQIYESSFGHPRNAIQILEQVLKVDEDERLEVAKRAEELQTQSIDLCRALIKHAPWKQVATILDGLKKEDAESVRRHLLAYAQTVLLGGTNDKAALIIEELLEPTYNTGFAGLVYACYAVTKN